MLAVVARVRTQPSANKLGVGEYQEILDVSSLHEQLVAQSPRHVGAAGGWPKK